MAAEAMAVGVILVDERVSRLLQWKRGEQPDPSGIELAPTLRCNLSCPFCWRQAVHSLSSEGEMPIAKYLEILDQAAELNVREVKIIGGGESTVRRDTVDIMCAVKEREMRGYICTNGTLFSDDDVKRIVSAGFDHLKMSFHAHNAVLGDKLLGRKGAFQKQLDALRRFAHHKKALGIEQPSVELGVVLMNSNFPYLPDIMMFAGELGVNAVFIEPITVYSDKGKKLKMSDAEREAFRDIAEKSIDLASSLGVATNLQNYLDAEMVTKTGEMQDVLYANAAGSGDTFVSNPCFEPFLRMGIRFDGQVGPCGFLDEVSPENVNKSTLTEIWHGQYFQQLRKRMLDNKLLSQCSRCCSTLVVNNRELRTALEQASGQPAEVSR